MSKRVQYAQSMPVLQAAPPTEAGRVVIFALGDGLHALHPDGEVVGPLAAMPETGDLVTLDTSQTITGPKVYGPGTLLMSSPVAALAEPYSDANPPESLIMLERTDVPDTPATLHSVLWSDTDGRLFLKHHDGTIFELTNQAASTTPVKSAKTVWVDFGATPTYTGRFTITDPAITASTALDVTQSGAAAPGRPADENEMDPLLPRATPGAGSAQVYVTALEGPVSGVFGLNYQVG